MHTRSRPDHPSVFSALGSTARLSLRPGLAFCQKRLGHPVEQRIRPTTNARLPLTPQHNRRPHIVIALSAYHRQSYTNPHRLSRLPRSLPAGYYHKPRPPG